MPIPPRSGAMSPTIDGITSLPQSPISPDIQSVPDSATTPTIAGRRSTDSTDAKLCGVCGDHALGYNFNAITCESCKAFFRRNALKPKEFKCPFNNNCNVDVVTRRFCQKCRLEKCFKIGMKKEWIMSEEEKLLKKQKIEENRKKRNRDSPMKADSSPVAPTPRNTPQNASPHVPTNSVTEKIFIADKCEQHDGTSQQYYILGNGVVVRGEVIASTGNDSSPSILAQVLTIPTKGTHQEPEVMSNNFQYMKKSRLDETGKILTEQETSGNNIELANCNSTPTDSAVSSQQTNKSEIRWMAEPALHLKTEKETAGNCSEGPPYLSTTTLVPNVHAFSLKRKHVDESCDSWTADDRFLSKQQQSVQTTGPLQFSPPASVSSDSETFSPATLLLSPDLSPLQQQKIQELHIANLAMKAPFTDEEKFNTGSDPSLLNVINLTDIAIRRIIKMSKKISGFKALSQEDQIALLKGGCIETMILRSVMTYNPENDCWLGPPGPKNTMKINLAVLRKANANLYDEHKRFIHSFAPEWRQNEIVMLILSAITLFEPTRPNVVHEASIQKEQNPFQRFYIELLRDYLYTLYSSDEAENVFNHLRMRLRELHILNTNHVEVYMNVNPKEVEPLLIEIFDLKQHH